MRSFHRVLVWLLVMATASPAFAQETHKKSPAMAAGGAVLISVGVLTVMAGGLLTAWAVTSHAATDRGTEPPPYGLLGVAIPVDVGAIGSIVAGAVMVALGSHRVRVEKVSFSPTGLRIAF